MDGLPGWKTMPAALDCTKSPDEGKIEVPALVVLCIIAGLRPNSIETASQPEAAYAQHVPGHGGWERGGGGRGGAILQRGYYFKIGPFPPQHRSPSFDCGTPSLNLDINTEYILYNIVPPEVKLVHSYTCTCYILSVKNL